MDQVLKSKIRLLMFFLAFFPLYLAGQQVTGLVFTEENGVRQTLPGVNIHWENSQKGTVTDQNGSFTIARVNGSRNLVFSFVGYNTVTSPVDGSKPLEVELKSDLELKEITVVKKDNGRRNSTHDPILTESINGAELLKAACCNLAESFETNPSVDVSYNDAVSGAKQIKLLGLEGIYSQLQTDNISNFRGLATNFGLTYIPGPWMESIQISKGTASVINGYESITGQINVAYKKPDSQEKLHLNAYSDADGKMEFNANSNLRLYKDKLTAGIFVHAEQLSNEIDHNHDGFLDLPRNKQLHFLNTWKFYNRKGLMLHGALRFLWDDRLGGEAAFRRDMLRTQGNPYGIGITNRMAEGVVKAGYAWPSGHLALAFLSNMVGHETSSFYGLNDYSGNEFRYYSNLVLTYDLDNSSQHTLNAGFSYLSDRFRENLNSRAMDREESVPGIFAEYTFKPSDKLTLMTGIRSDFHNLFGTFFTPRIHFRYQPDPKWTFRVSAGEGYRTANVLAENNYLLANFRSLYFPEVLQEKAWNFGLSFIQKYKLMQRDLEITAEFFRTTFQKQLVMNKEASPETIFLQPLRGQSFANTLQAEVRYPVVRNLDLTLAYRLNDVKQSINGRLLDKIYSSRYKGLVTLNYTTNLKKWMFDYTLQFNGGGRLPVDPEAAGNTEMPAEFPSYSVMNFQVSRFFRFWNVYAGVENLTDFMQENPVLGAGQPFLNGFDATNIWGPVMGRRIYAGIRFTLKYS